MLALSAAGCSNGGRLVADRGLHSAIAISDGYPVWIRDTDFSGTPGAVNRLTIDTRAVTPLVRQGSLWSPDDTDLDLATSGGVVYFTTTTSVMSVAVTGGDATVIVDESQHGRPLFVAADSDHVYWTRWSGGIVAQSLADGSQTTIASTSTAEALAVDDTNVYWYDWQGLWKTPKVGGAVAQLAPEALPNSRLQIAGGFVYWLAFDGVKRIPVAGGVASTVATDVDMIDDFAIDDRFVYWASVHETCTGTDNDNCNGVEHLRRQALDGGAVATLGTPDGVEGIVATAGKVFVLNQDGVNIF